MTTSSPSPLCLFICLRRLSIMIFFVKFFVDVVFLSYYKAVTLSMTTSRSSFSCSDLFPCTMNLIDGGRELRLTSRPRSLATMPSSPLDELTCEFRLISALEMEYFLFELVILGICEVLTFLHSDMQSLLNCPVSIAYKNGFAQLFNGNTNTVKILASLRLT